MSKHTERSDSGAKKFFENILEVYVDRKRKIARSQKNQGVVFNSHKKNENVMIRNREKCVLTLCDKVKAVLTEWQKVAVLRLCLTLWNKMHFCTLKYGSLIVTS